MTRTTFAGGVASGGGSTAATEASALYALRFSFDPTSASQVLLGTLPADSRVIETIGLGGATGGTNPTVDIGTTGDDDGIANELDADGVSATLSAGTGGALVGTKFSAATAVYGKVGASAATGGTCTGMIVFMIGD